MELRVWDRVLGGERAEMGLYYLLYHVVPQVG